MDLKQTIMHRDNLSAYEADNLIDEAVAELFDLLDNGLEDEAYNICEDLEPDFLNELI